MVDSVPHPLGEAFYRRKVGFIQARLSERRFDGLLLLDPHNVIYTSGFFHSPSERPIGFYIPASGEPTLFVPLLEREHAAATWVGDVRSYFEYPGEEHPVAWMARETGARHLSVDHLTVGGFETIRRTGVIPASTDFVERLRFVKESEELALVARAARYADLCLQFVFDHAGEIIRDGGSELDVLSACLTATRSQMDAELGSAFATTRNSVVGTVHSGPRAALPHGQPIDRKPGRGDVLIAGIGASVGGYHAESGATFVLGTPSADQLRCLEAAAACNDAAVASLRPGAVCSQVNGAALAVLENAGLGDNIRHRVGHGMGVQGHEGPWLAPGDDTRLQPGMVFSNEPGIYRPGIDGYRTINSMIVTPGEAYVVSRFLAAHPPEERVIEL